MVISAFFAFLHFTAVFGVVGTLSYEWLAMSKSPSYIDARKIQLCDLWYGISAAILLVVGFLRVYLFEKGKDFYLSNPFFILKIFLFLVVGLLSIYPTVRFIKWRKETKRGLPPVVTERQFASISIILRLELMLLLVIAFCASLMARGISL
jgi:putative membrane protein